MPGRRGRACRAAPRARDRRRPTGSGFGPPGGRPPAPGSSAVRRRDRRHRGRCRASFRLLGGGKYTAAKETPRLVLGRDEPKTSLACRTQDGSAAAPACRVGIAAAVAVAAIATAASIPTAMTAALTPAAAASAAAAAAATATAAAPDRIVGIAVRITQGGAPG